MRANNYGATLSHSIDFWLWVILLIPPVELKHLRLSQITSWIIWNVNLILSEETIYVGCFFSFEFESTIGVVHRNSVYWTEVRSKYVQLRVDDKTPMLLGSVSVSLSASRSPHQKWEETQIHKTYLREHRTIKLLVNRNIYNESTYHMEFSQWNLWTRACVCSSERGQEEDACSVLIDIEKIQLTQWEMANYHNSVCYLHC